MESIHPVLPQWGDALWVWAWSLTGGILVWQMRSRCVGKAESPLRSVLGIGISFLVLYGLCWLILLQGGWLPLIPAAIALVITGGAIAYIPFPSRQPQ